MIYWFFLILFVLRVRPQIPVLKDVEPLLELDRDERKFDTFLTFHRNSLLVSDLKIFLPFTINLDPYIKKVIKGECIMGVHILYWKHSSVFPGVHVFYYADVFVLSWLWWYVITWVQFWYTGCCNCHENPVLEYYLQFSENLW